MLRNILLRTPHFAHCRNTNRFLATSSNSPSSSKFTIPIIDLHTFLTGTSVEKSLVAEKVLNGFISCGFIYLTNTGINSNEVANVFSWSQKFFQLPMEEKMKLAWETPESNRGYVAPGREKVSRLIDQGEIEKIR